MGSSRWVLSVASAALVVMAGVPSSLGETPTTPSQPPVEQQERKELLKAGPDNRMVANPALAPAWYRPHLADWYREQISRIENNRFKYIPYLVKDDSGWIDDLLAVDGNSNEVKVHVYYISDHDDNFRRMLIEEPLKNPTELIDKVSRRYRSLLIRLYRIKIKELEALGTK